MENNQQNAAKAKSAIPSCPKCDLNKAQFQKTMTNYSKAYRKKVEGLKTELKTSRATIGRLSKQVRGLKSITRVHLPSLVIGALVGVGLVKLLGLLKARRSNKAAVTESEAEEEAEDQAAEDKELEAAQ